MQQLSWTFYIQDNHLYGLDDPLLQKVIIPPKLRQSP